jgi:mono/diheme cytochrome c family protein
MLPRLRGIGITALMCSFAAFVVVLAAQPGANPAAVKRMHDHLTTLDSVHYAVVRGDLDDAKTASQSLSDQLSMDGLPPDGQKHLSDLKAAAIAGTKSATLEDAGTQTGKMTAACGTCHSALGKPVKMAAPQKPAGEPSLKTRMLEHDYAVRLLAAGLTGPSDEMWKSGATAMKTAKLWTITLKDADLTKQVNDAEVKFRELADKAVSAKDPAAKAAVYGEIAAGCGHCHSLGGRVFGPGVPK